MRLAGLEGDVAVTPKKDEVKERVEGLSPEEYHKQVFRRAKDIIARYGSF